MPDNPEAPKNVYTLTHTIWCPEPLRQEVIDSLEYYRAEARERYRSLERCKLPAWIRGPDAR